MVTITLTKVLVILDGCDDPIAVTYVAEAMGMKVAANKEKSVDCGFAYPDQLAVLRLLVKLHKAGHITPENTSPRLVEVLTEWGEVRGIHKLYIHQCFIASYPWKPESRPDDHNIRVEEKTVSIPINPSQMKKKT